MTSLNFFGIYTNANEPAVFDLKDRHHHQVCSQKRFLEVSTPELSSPCVALNLLRYHNQSYNCRSLRVFLKKKPDVSKDSAMIVGSVTQGTNLEHLARAWNLQLPHESFPAHLVQHYWRPSWHSLYLVGYPHISVSVPRELPVYNGLRRFQEQQHLQLLALLPGLDLYEVSEENEREK